MIKAIILSVVFLLLLLLLLLVLLFLLFLILFRWWLTSLSTRELALRNEAFLRVGSVTVEREIIHSPHIAQRNFVEHR